MISTLKLPFRFDAGKLRDDVRLFAPDSWTPHFNVHYYEGDWSGMALRAPQDANVSLFPDPAASRFVDTEALSHCMYVPQVLKAFKCSTETVRFLRLGAGSAIHNHRDYELSFEDGLARVHIPVTTNPLVEFIHDGKLIEMTEGEAWYLNFNLHHSVANNSFEDRVHLVIDCVVNDWLRDIFAANSKVQ